MRVLILSDRIPPDRSAAGSVAWGLAEGLRDRAHDVAVVTTHPEKSSDGVVDGIRVVALRSRVSERWRAYASLYHPTLVGQVDRVLAGFRPDVVHAHNVHAHLSYGCLTAAQRRGIPVVFTAHDVMSFAYGKLTHYVDPLRCPSASPEQYRLPVLHNLRQARLRYNPFRNLRIRHVLRKHVRVRIAVSEVLRLALEANGLGGFRVVHNGVEAGNWQTSEQEVLELRGRLGLRDRPVILLAGRINEAKGRVQTLAALRRVVARVPNATLLVLSDRPFPLAPQEADLTTFVREAGWLTGASLAAAFGLASMLVVPSVYLDPSPLINMDAMAAGKPVIATCHGGSPEIVRDGVTGYIVNPYDSETFADRILGLLTNASLRDRLGAAGRERFLTEFTLERHVERMAAIYDEAIGRPAE
jgi:glycosyltransferase involved in cell wall biosynthesis